MKRNVYLFSLIALFFMIAVLAGCSRSDKVRRSSEEIVSDVTIPEVTPEKTDKLESAPSENEDNSDVETEKTEFNTADHSEEQDTENETDSEEAVRNEAFHVVLGTSGVKDLARKKGLSLELENEECEPIFRLDSTEDIELLCKVFAEDHAYGTDKTYLAEGMKAYDEAFFTDHELYVVYYFAYTESYKEEDFTVESLVQNRVLHFQITVSYPLNRFVDHGSGGYWIYIPMERSKVKNLIAYDASTSMLVYHELPPDWTEPVNPDWREAK